jgi:hypothetical protein
MILFSWQQDFNFSVSGNILCQKRLNNETCDSQIIILPVVLYGCETWSLTLREEHRLRVFQNGVLRRIPGATRDEVTAEWRK